MQRLSTNRENALILSFSIIAVLGALFVTQDIDRTKFLLFGISGLALLSVFLFYNIKGFYLLLITLIPISIDTGMLGGAKLSFPSEGLLVMLLPILFLFNDGYRRTIVKIIKHPLTILLLIDLFIQVFTSITGTHIDVSMKRVMIRFLFIAGFYVTVNMISEKQFLIKPWVFYAVGLVPVMYFTFKNHIYHSFNPKVVFSISQPYYADHTLYGACLAFVIPILIVFLSKRKVLGVSKIVWWAILAITLLVITSEFFALSRAAILSLFVSLFFYILLYFNVKFKSILIGLSIVLIGSFVMKDTLYSYIEQNESVSNDGKLSNHFSSVTNVQSDASNLERINRWICAVRMFENRPLLGYGPGTYQFEYNQFQTVETKTYISTNSGDKGNAHSEYLTYLSETGIFGFIIFVLTVFASVYYGMQNHELARDIKLRAINLAVLLGLITFYFHGIFNSFIDQSKMGFLYFTALGTIVWISQKIKEEAKFKDDLA